MADVGDIYPGTTERIVAKLKNPNGPGYWLQGERGGVFAEEGAPFLGSYMGESAATRNDPNRRFTNIVAEGSGYRSISATPGEGGYGYQPRPTPTPPVTTTGTTPPPGTIDASKTPAAQSAKGLIASTLAAVGLPTSLADTLWNDNYLNQGRPIQTIIDVDIPQSDAFKAKFPAFDKFQAQTGGTVKDYIGQVDTYAGLMKAAGLPSGFYDEPGDFAKFMSGGVSPKEVSDRIGLAKEAALTAPPAVHDYLVNQEGLDANNLAAFFLDPDKGDLVKQQALMTRGEIAGAGAAAGFGGLTRAQTGGVQTQGVTGEQAAQRFGELAPMAQGLFAGQTAEEAQTGTGVGTAEVLGHVAGQAASDAAIAAAKARRAAKFQGGGGAASGGGGRTGLG